MFLLFFLLFFFSLLFFLMLESMVDLVMLSECKNKSIVLFELLLGFKFVLFMVLSVFLGVLLLVVIVFLSDKFESGCLSELIIL